MSVLGRRCMRLGTSGQKVSSSGFQGSGTFVWFAGIGIFERLAGFLVNLRATEMQVVAVQNKCPQGGTRSSFTFGSHLLVRKCVSNGPCFRKPFRTSPMRIAGQGCL